MKHKLCLWLAVLVCMSVLLTACSAGQTAADPTASTQTADATISPDAAYDRLLAAFGTSVATPVVPARTTPAMSYAEYFSAERNYDALDFVYEPDWMRQGGYTILPSWMQEDGYTSQPDFELAPEAWVLGLYDADGTRLIGYTDAPYLSWKMGDEGLYVFAAQKIESITYDGKTRTTLFSAPEGQIVDFAATNDVLFFAVQTQSAITIYRLYVPEERLDVIYDAIPADAKGFSLGQPVSNQAVIWSVYDPEFLLLAEEHQAEYQEKYQLDPEDTVTYWGMLELDFDVSSAQRFYYNCAADTLRSQKYGLIYLPAERTEADIEKNGDAWWLDEG